MSENIEGYEIPSLSFLGDEPLIKGVPRKQAACVLLFGMSVYMPVMKFVSIWVALAAVIVLSAVLLIVLKWLYGKDPYWYQHMTSHKYPLVRYTGD